ncbi:hypothetical protein WJX72_003560 [[Myrmecia] bisecta]|uniref:Ubiquinol-cytochrome c chaperone domain-containing protein n=1 Tax=[Myrmecia] bisecta TaxID=41462 RepID=A0AAW1QEX7_9CHLO
MLRRGLRQLTQIAAPHISPARQSSCAQGLRPAAQIACQHTLASGPDFKAALFNAHPRSLEADTATEQPNPGVEENFLTRALLRLGGYYSRESRLLRGAKTLYDGVVEQATDTLLYNALGLENKFPARYAMLSLHVWMCLVRLRAEGDDGKDLAQMLYENFTDDVEKRVHAEGVKVRVSKHLKELEKMFYGSSMAYDKALKGDGDLAEALLRNVYINDTSKKAQAGLLARYVRRELACLNMTDSSAVLDGKIRFSPQLKAVKPAHLSSSWLRLCWQGCYGGGEGTLRPESPLWPKPAEALPSSRPNSSLPRNKASKSARSRQRKQEERKKKAVEEDAKKAAKNAGPAYDSDDEENNKLILTSKFYDSARRDTLTGPVSRIPSLGGAASQQR